MWQKQAKSFIENGDLVAIGVVQEQHPARTRLYRQWRELKWPIFVDSMNSLAHVRVVPIPMALDENGVVVHSSFRPNQLEAFMGRKAATVDASANIAPKADIQALRDAASAKNTPEAWRDLGVALFEQGTPAQLNDSVSALQRSVELVPEDVRSQFALGTALRRRYESNWRVASDSQKAVKHWGLALEGDPNHYIYRRRLQQYGPRLDKPYNFYFWVERARDDIRKRGETPIQLAAEPMGSEIAAPQRSAATVTITARNPDPEGRITRDEKGLVQVETLVTPDRVQAGHRVRVRTTFRLNPEFRPFWNNEADDLEIWLDLPDGLTLGEAHFAYTNPSTPETQELRQLEFEIVTNGDVSSETYVVPGYVLYYVCENSGGTCYYLRQNFSLDLTVSPEAPILQ